MRTPCRRFVVVPLLAGLLFLLLQGKAGAVVLLFKDGFTLQGIVTDEKGTIVDPKSGAPFRISTGKPFRLDDDVRRITFSPLQVADVLPDPRRTTNPLVLKRTPPRTVGSPLPAAFEIDTVGPWDAKWHRKVTLDTGNRRFDVEQRISILSPEKVCVHAIFTYWISWYRTQELGPEAVRGLVRNYYASQKSESPTSRRTETARFLLEAGWPDLAEKELAGFKDAKGQQSLIDDVQAQIKQVRAERLVSDLQTAYKAGQYEKARDLATRFFKEDVGRLVDPKVLVQVQDLRTRLAAERQRLQDVRRLLRALVERAPDVRKEAIAKAVAAILDELGPDTLPRLQAFLDQARAWEQAAKQGRAAAQTAEQVLAYALTGWLQGNEAASDQADAALRLWQARDVVLAYLRTDERRDRRNLIAGKTGSPLRPDVVARLIKYLPPPEPWQKIGPGPIPMQSRGPDGAKGSPYLVQLPPEYHPSRAYPVLVVLHGGDEKPAAILKKWSELAARHGFILAAPTWAGGIGASNYGYTEREHAAVLNCLWDLRRHFQVDSDRVFLFGAEQAGYMAFDVGLSHPDQFAGVSTMDAYPNFFAIMYWHNAQFLPFYVVDGDKQYKVAQVNDKVFESWSRRGWPALLFSYRGRIGDWFSAELPSMMDWMSRKKRVFPQQTLGRANRAEEFQTMRATDNRFYWLSTDAITPRHLNDIAAWDRNRGMQPALLQGEITGGNYVHLHTSGLKQVTIWLGPGMINFGQKIKVQVNGAPSRAFTVQPNLGTLLEDFYQRGDRQQLFLARIDLKL